MLPEVKFVGNAKVDAGDVYLVDYNSELKAIMLHHVTGAITMLPVKPKTRRNKNRHSN